jgi:protein-S-isoprenylcysteine O-methyltransferase Ste14
VTLQEWGKTAQKIRVPAAIVIGLGFLVLMHPSVHSLWIGGVVAFAGALTRIWAAGHIEKGRSLAQGGPYALTRNPLYLGSLLMAVGVLLAGQGYWLLVPLAIFYLAIYYPVMKAEERELLQVYGDPYRDYARKVPIFFPGFGAASRTSTPFLWSLVLKNGEHRTLAWFLIAEIFLILRKIY